uniref:ZZ-type domain-containing protein n=1 Tax=Nitrosopumivirus cobalaminus TaxID=3158414 RepID=A0AAU7N4B0_9VIRU
MTFQCERCKTSHNRPRTVTVNYVEYDLCKECSYDTVDFCLGLKSFNGGNNGLHV